MKARAGRTRGALHLSSGSSTREIPARWRRAGRRRDRRRTMARRHSINVALDIGTHKTSVLVAANGDASPHVIGLGTAPSMGLKRGVVVNIDSTVQSIQHAVREAEVMADCEIPQVIVSVSGNHVRGFNSHGMVPIRTREVTPNDVELVLDAARAGALPRDTAARA